MIKETIGTIADTNIIATMDGVQIMDMEATDQDMATATAREFASDSARGRKEMSRTTAAREKAGVSANSNMNAAIVRDSRLTHTIETGVIGMDMGNGERKA
jgi:hypothetical protein